MTCCRRFLTTIVTPALAFVLASCQKSPAPGATAQVAVAALEPLPPYDAVGSLHQQVSGGRALTWARAVSSFGARPAGSEALEKTRLYLEKELKTMGWVTERQTFEDTTPRGRITFVNVCARFGGDGDPWQWVTPLLIASHYDTKFFPQFNFVGANDGASGNAVQLEIARILSTEKSVAQRIELIFF